jgi:hypothetical protein
MSKEELMSFENFFQKNEDEMTWSDHPLNETDSESTDKIVVPPEISSTTSKLYFSPSFCQLTGP